MIMNTTRPPAPPFKKQRSPLYSSQARSRIRQHSTWRAQQLQHTSSLLIVLQTLSIPMRLPRTFSRDFPPAYYLISWSFLCKNSPLYHQLLSEGTILSHTTHVSIKPYELRPYTTSTTMTRLASQLFLRLEAISARGASMGATGSTFVPRRKRTFPPMCSSEFVMWE